MGVGDSIFHWLGTSTFELDLLHQLTAATDHKGNRVEYTYYSYERWCRC